jgi:hypothetical protein
MSSVRAIFMGQNWTITPAAPGPNEAAPRSFWRQKWMLVVTGVVAYNERTPNGELVGIQGNNPHDWRRGGVRIGAPGAVSDAMFAMINQYGVTRLGSKLINGMAPPAKWDFLPLRTNHMSRTC